MSERTRTLGPGLTMAVVDEVLAQLGPDVTEEMLRKWHTRYGLHRAKLDGRWWYHLEGSIETEFLVSSSGRGRPRRAHLLDLVSGDSTEARLLAVYRSAHRR